MEVHCRTGSSEKHEISSGFNVSSSLPHRQLRKAAEDIGTEGMAFTAAQAAQKFRFSKSGSLPGVHCRTGSSENLSPEIMENDQGSLPHRQLRNDLWRG